MHIIIGKAATETVVMHFQCPKGHRLIASKPITIGFYAETSDLGPPVCPFCLIEFVRTEFPMTEVLAPSKAPPVAPMSAHTDPLAVAGMVMARPCTVKGCILMEHPGTDQHINASRQPFTVATP